MTDPHVEAVAMVIDPEAWAVTTAQANRGWSSPPLMQIAKERSIEKARTVINAHLQYMMENVSDEQSSAGTNAFWRGKTPRQVFKAMLSVMKEEEK